MYKYTRLHDLREDKDMTQKEAQGVIVEALESL